MIIRKSSNITAVLVASTNPAKHINICKESNRKDNSNIQVLIGERHGLKSHAMLECSKVESLGTQRIPLGNFKCITNVDRCDMKLLIKMISKSK